jgi:hypothetical protein
MRRLGSPPFGAIDVYKTCVAEIDDDSLRNTFDAALPLIVDKVTSFDNATATASWCNLPRAKRGHGDTVIVGALTKEQLVALYDDHMVKAPGPARKIYDDILVAAAGHCPFCGGIGHVKTLDHYLPKSIFPAYSVLPHNLVPSCRDCNTGKNASFATQAQDQALHPYLDDQKFFQERWIVAEIAKTNPILVSFKCAPPPTWSDTEQNRARSHFTNYNISSRYSIQAATEVSTVTTTRGSSLKILSPLNFRAYLLDHANSGKLDLNGWNRTMYAALAETSWFLTTDFSVPDWENQ